MTSPEIILYDLASTKKTCFSPTVWKTRLTLNYKGIPYETVWVEFPDIEPKMKELGIAPHQNETPAYTVPTIYHVPTKTYLTDSLAISKFLEQHYPNQPIVLSSDLGGKIDMRVIKLFTQTLGVSLPARERLVLAPRTQEWFRKSNEAVLGLPLEDLYGKEDAAWAEKEEEYNAVGGLLLTNKDQGPWVLGDKPSWTDFTVLGWLQSTKIIDEKVFARVMRHPGYQRLYEACTPYMDRKD